MLKYITLLIFVFGCAPEPSKPVDKIKTIDWQPQQAQIYQGATQIEVGPVVGHVSGDTYLPKNPWPDDVYFVVDGQIKEVKAKLVEFIKVLPPDWGERYLYRAILTVPPINDLGQIMVLIEGRETMPIAVVFDVVQEPITVNLRDI